MTCREIESLPLPTATQIFWTPERAILALLDANLLLATRALNAQHPEFDDPDAEPLDTPLLLMSRAITATAASLRRLIAGYDDVAERLTELENAPPRRPVPSSAPGRNDDDIF